MRIIYKIDGNHTLYTYSYLTVKWIQLINILQTDPINGRYADTDDDLYVSGHSIDYLKVFNVNENSLIIPANSDLSDLPLYQNIDNNAIFFKYIDYSINPDAQTFADMFQFEQFVSKPMINLKANSCYINTIIATFKNPIEKVKSNGVRRYKEEINYEYICQLLNIENKEQDLGITIRQSIPFFDRYHLCLVVLDIYNNIIFRYPKNDTKNTIRNISPHTLYLLVHNNHCFKLRADKSFITKMHNKICNDVFERVDNKYVVHNEVHELKQRISDKFIFRNLEKEQLELKYDIENLDDVVTHEKRQ